MTQYKTDVGGQGFLGQPERIQSVLEALEANVRVTRGEMTTLILNTIGIPHTDRNRRAAGNIIKGFRSRGLVQAIFKGSKRAVAYELTKEGKEYLAAPPATDAKPAREKRLLAREQGVLSRKIGERITELDQKKMKLEKELTEVRFELAKYIQAQKVLEEFAAS